MRLAVPVGAGPAYSCRVVRTRRTLRVVGAVALAVLAVAGAGWPVLVHPQVDRVGTADAVVVLGGDDSDGRADEGLRLARAGVAGQLVLSDPYRSARTRTAAVCRGRYPGIDVTCFAPAPSTTQGEAQRIRELAQERGWTSIVVVTGVYHVSRARWIISRCFPGRISMTAPATRPGPLGWAYQYLYQSAAYVKAALRSGC